MELQKLTFTAPSMRCQIGKKTCKLECKVFKLIYLKDLYSQYLDYNSANINESSSANFSQVMTSLLYDNLYIWEICSYSSVSRGRETWTILKLVGPICKFRCLKSGMGNLRHVCQKHWWGAIHPKHHVTCFTILRASLMNTHAVSRND